MSRSALSRRPVRAVLALAVGVASVVGAAQASAAAPAVALAVTGVSPSHVEAESDTAFGVTLTGKGFTRDTVVTFSGCATNGVTVPPVTATATKLVVKPPRCAAGVKDVVVTRGTGATAPTATLRGRLTYLEAPVVQALAPATAAVQPSTASWAGCAAATVTVEDDLPAKAVVQVLVTTGGVTRPVPGKVDPSSARRIAFTVPAGTPGAQPDVAVSVFGISSEPVEEQLTYVSTIRTTPAVWVRGAPAPTVRIDGAGFTGTPTVTICDKPAALVAGKAPTARTLVVTPPAWDAVLGDEAAQAAGGVCTVKVVSGDQTSVVSAGSTFTYAAY